MSKQARLSILGMYYADNDIFENLEIPEELDSDVLIPEILMQCAELELIYEDPDFMKMAIGIWSKKELDVWQKLYATTVLEYNPIWNKDGTVTESESVVRDASNSETSSDTSTAEGSRTGTSSTDGETSRTGSSSENRNEIQNTEGTQSSTQVTDRDFTNDSEDTLTVAGFDASTFQNREKKVLDAEGTEDITVTTNSSGQNSGVTTGETSGTETETGTSSISQTEAGTESSMISDSHEASDTHNESTARTYERRETGNIGVTTTQQMIKEEREIDLFSIYDAIVDSFKNRFCILVY